MKKIKTNMINVIVMVLVLLLGTLPVKAETSSSICGTTNWVIDDNGVLTISPIEGESGTLANWGSGTPPWYSERASIKNVKFEGTIQATTGFKMFEGCVNLEAVDTQGLSVSGVTNLSHMFADCKKLKQIDVSNWDVSSVKSTLYMFHSCSSLTSFDASNWTTSSLTNLSAMFIGCTSLAEANIKSFDTSKIETTRQLFAACSNLRSIDLSGWNTSRVTDMSFMFNECNALKSIDFTGWNTSKVKSIESIFNGCRSLEELDVSNWDVSKVENINDAFRGCGNLAVLDTSNWEFKNLKTAHRAFQNSGVKNLDVSKWGMEKVEYCVLMFKSAKIENFIGLEQWHPICLISADYMFDTCNSLKSMILNWDLPALETAKGMFEDCAILEELNFSEVKTNSNVRTDAFLGSSYGQPLPELRKITIGEDCLLELTLHSTAPFIFEIALDPDNPKRYDRKIPGGSTDQIPIGEGAATYVVGYEIAFDPNGGEGTMEDELYCYSYPKKELIKNEFQRDGYTFIGWNSKADGSGVSFQDEEILEHEDFIQAANNVSTNRGYKQKLSDRIILYAQWEKSYEITFKDDDGTIISGPTKYVEGTLASDIVKPSDPTKDSTDEYTYTFAGWDPEIVDVTEDAVYTATYNGEKNNYEITFDPSGGFIDDSTDPIVLTYPYGTEIDIIEAPIREGYKFLYWKGSEYQPGSKYTVTENHTFTAQWQLVPLPTATPSPNSMVKPIVPNKTSDQKTKGERIVNTGDDNENRFYFAMLLGALALIVIVWYKRRQYV